MTVERHNLRRENVLRALGAGVGIAGLAVTALSFAANQPALGLTIGLFTAVDVALVTINPLPSRGTLNFKK